MLLNRRVTQLCTYNTIFRVYWKGITLLGKKDCVYESFADSKTRARDIGELDIQICGDCNNKLKSIKKDTPLSHKKMLKRTFAYHNLLSTDHLPKLIIMEVISIAKYITCLQVIQLRELHGAHQ